jgi:hypothetical protein
MLPGLSGSSGEFVSIGGIGIRERTADLTEIATGEMVRAQASHPPGAGEALMRVGMGDGAAKCSPEPFKAIGFGIIGGV